MQQQQHTAPPSAIKAGLAKGTERFFEPWVFTYRLAHWGFKGILGGLAALGCRIQQVFRRR